MYGAARMIDYLCYQVICHQHERCNDSSFDSKQLAEYANSLSTLCLYPAKRSKGLSFDSIVEKINSGVK